MDNLRECLYGYIYAIATKYEPIKLSPLHTELIEAFQWKYLEGEPGEEALGIGDS